jgi:hypothetical protein
MDFYTVLDQVLALLRQRGRVSYRALKRQFQLDDETLADLTAELLYAHHPVGEEEGSGLVWLGDASTAPEAPSPLLQSEIPRSVQDTPGTRSASLPTTPPRPEAERRQLTVLFCDLVDSTALAGQHTLLKVIYKVRRFSRYERHSVTVVTTIKPIAHRSIAASVWYRNCS